MSSYWFLSKTGHPKVGCLRNIEFTNMNIQNTTRTKQLAKNVAFLYIRMFIVLLVTLYTSRLVLSVLGVDDYGIYGVVGGIVVLFNVLSASFSESTSRFFSFELGRNNTSALFNIFHSAKKMHFILGLIIFILALIVGLWLIEYQLQIPTERSLAAKSVLISSIISFVIKLNSIPYRALIIAYEKMNFFAVFSLVEVFIRLINVYVLLVVPYDHLIMYGVLSLIEPIITFFVLSTYCRNKFLSKQKISIPKMNKEATKNMAKFAGWDMLGAIERILQDQGVNILINMFFLPYINAARSIAYQIKNAVSQFSTSFQIAANPQITKSYADNDLYYMHNLIFRVCKFSFFLLLIIIVPLLAHTFFWLSIWLKEVPDHTVLFVKLILIMVLTDAFYEILNQGAKATGKLKKFRIITSSISLLNVPISYCILSLGFSAEVTVVIAIILCIGVLIAQLWILQSLINLSIKYFIKYVILRTYPIAIFFVLWTFIYPSIIHINTVGAILGHTTILCILLGICIYYYGMTNNEKDFFRQFINAKILFFLKKQK